MLSAFGYMRLRSAELSHRPAPWGGRSVCGSALVTGAIQSHSIPIPNMSLAVGERPYLLPYICPALQAGPIYTHSYNCTRSACWRAGPAYLPYAFPPARAGPLSFPFPIYVRRSAAVLLRLRSAELSPSRLPLGGAHIHLHPVQPYACRNQLITLARLGCGNKE